MKISALHEATTNKKIDVILPEISKLSREDKELLRIQLQAANWLQEGAPLLQQLADDGEISLSDINEIKHLSRRKNA